MRSERRSVVRRARLFVLAFIAVIVLLGADGCGNRAAKHALVDLMETLNTPAWGNIDAEAEEFDRLRVHLYPDPIEEGEWVGPFIPGEDTDGSNRIVCQSDEGCFVLFVDTDHWAHFAHKTVVALWRLDTGRFQPPVVGEWWPLLNGTPVFDKVRKREDWFNTADPDDMQTIVYPEDLPRVIAPGFMANDEMGFSVTEPLPLPSPSPPPSPGPGPVPTPEAVDDCDVWAVIVNGFNDVDDTFHIDTGGMYQALRGHGIPQDQIHYLCPDPAGSEGCETVASEVELQKVLTETMGTDIPPTANLVDSSCQELLFFYSTHGDSDILWCGDDQPTFDQLRDWLDQVNCAKITVVVEACNSGGLIGKLVPPPTGQARFIFTSTDQNGVSYRDVDWIDDDRDPNPGDIGSETVWGYVEAMGTGSVDADADQRISFSEATNYAIDKDITAAFGNQPGIHVGGTVSPAAHSCSSTSASNKMKIELAQNTVVSSAGPGEALRCRCNLLSAEVTFPAVNPPALASATFYWTDEPWTASSGLTWDLDNQVHFKQIRNSTRLLPVQTNPYSIVVEWYVGSNIDAGTTITLLAVADAPDVPIPVGPIALDVLVADSWASAVKLEVVNPSSCFIFPCGCRTLRCD